MHAQPPRVRLAHPHPARRGRGRRAGLQQRLVQHQLQLIGAGDLAHRHPRLAQPGPERPLPFPAVRLLVKHPGRRDPQVRVLIQQEHQPGQARLGRGVEFQLGVGHLRLVPHRRPVPQPDQPHVHAAAAHRLPAVRRRLVLPRGEIRHVRDRVPGPRHRGRRRRHERPASRELGQLGGMTQEHPPGHPHHDQKLRRRSTGLHEHGHLLPKATRRMTTLSEVMAHYL